MDPPGDIIRAPPPWKLKGDVYMFSYWIPGKQARTAFPTEVAYSPLERASAFARSGRPVGGLSFVMILRYEESPVGAYNELIFATGTHTYEVEEGGKKKEKSNMRITRIYVSQKHSVWNGRRDWNCPKHLARFAFEDLPGGATSIAVYPHDLTDDPSDPAPAADAPPFFRAVYRPVRFLPWFPLSTGLFGWLGVDTTLVMPPVPQGKGSQGELTASERWVSFDSVMRSGRTAVGWFDLQQYEEKETEREDGKPKNFWPGLGRWAMGLKMENADIEFVRMKYWDAPVDE